jgi:hypothetical protein
MSILLNNVMLNDENSIFERYKVILEAYAGPGFSVARAAGTATDTMQTKPETVDKLKDSIRRSMLAKDVDERKIFYVPELLGIDPQKAEKLIMSNFGGSNPDKDKNILNPEPKLLGKFVIPLFELPNKILALNTRKGEKFPMQVLEKLKGLYKTFGGDPDNLQEVNQVYSGLKKFIERTYKGGITRTVAIPAVFGGGSEDDKFTHDYITNIRELEGPNAARLAKIVTHLYTGEERRDREGKESTQYKPEASNPENKTSNVSLGANVDSENENKIIDLQNQLFTLKSDPKTNKAKIKKLETEINNLTKVRGKGTSKKSVTIKPIVSKESYVPFIRVIPF